MTTSRYSPYSIDSGNVAGTALDNKVSGTRTLVCDIDNTTPRDLYVRIWASFGAFTPGSGSSCRFEIREKKSGQYAENAIDGKSCEVTLTGNRIVNLSASLLMPGPGVYGLYVMPNFQTNTPASGNSLSFVTYSEGD